MTASAKPEARAPSGVDPLAIYARIRAIREAGQKPEAIFVGPHSEWGRMVREVPWVEAEAFVTTLAAADALSRAGVGVLHIRLSGATEDPPCANPLGYSADEWVKPITLGEEQPPIAIGPYTARLAEWAATATELRMATIQPDLAEVLMMPGAVVDTARLVALVRNFDALHALAKGNHVDILATMRMPEEQAAPRPRRKRR